MNSVSSAKQQHCKKVEFVKFLEKAKRLLAVIAVIVVKDRPASISSSEMPKKFVGENSKAAAAKAKKAEKADADRAKKEKEIEDAKWVDDDKGRAKKQVRC